MDISSSSTIGTRPFDGHRACLSTSNVASILVLLLIDMPVAASSLRASDVRDKSAIDSFPVPPARLIHVESANVKDLRSTTGKGVKRHLCERPGSLCQGSLVLVTRPKKSSKPAR